MKKANIKGALVGIEAVTPGRTQGGLQGLEPLRRCHGHGNCRPSRRTGFTYWVHSSSGCPPTGRQTFDATVADGAEGGHHLCPVCDDDAVSGHRGLWPAGKRNRRENPTMVGDVPITRYWLIPTEVRPKMFTPHPTMSSDEIRERTQGSGTSSIGWGYIWTRSACCPNTSLRA
jgi:hypothetical protein